MRVRTILCILIVAINTSAFFIDKPKKYTATVITALGTFQGELKLDLYGSNEGKISIKTVDNKGSSGGIDIDAKMIEQVIIDTVTYYMEDLNDKGYDNRNRFLVTKTYGSDTLGIFSFNNGKNIEYYVGQANTEYLQNLNHDKLNGNLRFFYTSKYFEKCRPLFTKIKSKQEGYSTTASMTVEERLSFWKKAIDEYADCKE